MFFSQMDAEYFKKFQGHSISGTNTRKMAYLYTFWAWFLFTYQLSAEIESA